MGQIRSSNPYLNNSNENIVLYRSKRQNSYQRWKVDNTVTKNTTIILSKTTVDGTNDGKATAVFLRTLSMHGRN